MDFYQIVHQSAESLRLINREGQFIDLDSLRILRLITAIETSSMIRIAGTVLLPDVLESVESVARMVETLAAD